MSKIKGWYRFEEAQALQKFQRGVYWNFSKPKSDPRKVFHIDKKDRHSLWKLHKTGIDLNSLCDMLTSPDPDSQKYGVTVIEQNTVKLGKYLRKLIDWNSFGEQVSQPIEESIVRRIRNIQKDNKYQFL